jgi:hypothetical protein
MTLATPSKLDRKYPKLDNLPLNTSTAIKATTEAVALQVQEEAEAINLFITINVTRKVHLSKSKINRTL